MTDKISKEYEVSWHNAFDSDRKPYFQYVDDNRNIFIKISTEVIFDSLKKTPSDKLSREEGKNFIRENLDSILSQIDSLSSYIKIEEEDGKERKVLVITLYLLNKILKKQ